MRVIALNDQYVFFMYELASGTVGVCNTVRDETPEIYNNAQCEPGVPYTSTSSVFGDDDRPDRWPRHLYRLQDQWMYVDGTDCLLGKSMWRVDLGERVHSRNETFYCRIKPIPDWALNMLDNPPYTLQLEY